METKLTYAKPDPEAVEKLSQALGCHPVIAALLYCRGIQTPEAAHYFLNPTFKKLKDPFSLMDMDKAVERIHTAVLTKKKSLFLGILMQTG
jgi:single-stranded-DNA-specific exonuclease